MVPTELCDEWNVFEVGKKQYLKGTKMGVSVVVAVLH